VVYEQCNELEKVFSCLAQEIKIFEEYANLFKNSPLGGGFFFQRLNTLQMSMNEFGEKAQGEVYFPIGLAKDIKGMEKICNLVFFFKTNI